MMVLAKERCHRPLHPVTGKNILLEYSFLTSVYFQLLLRYHYWEFDLLNTKCSLRCSNLLSGYLAQLHGLLLITLQWSGYRGLYSPNSVSQNTSKDLSPLLGAAKTWLL